jgi:hypothetical protein
MACKQLFAVDRWTLETLPDSFAIPLEGHRNLLISQLIEISVVTPSEKKIQPPPRENASTAGKEGCYDSRRNT